MVAATTTSPNVGNLQVGKGIVSFQIEGSNTFRDLGEVSALSITPDLETLEHFTSRSGTKTRDIVVTIQKKAKLKLTMQEFTANNLGIMLLGAVDNTAAGGPEVEIFSENMVSGALRFVGTNDVGPKITVDLYNIQFQPTGDLSLISDEWGEMEVDASVNAATSGTNVGKFGVAKFTNVAPDTTP